jgi:chorismate synthase
MQLTETDIQPQMTRRRPGQSALTTPRDEKDRVEIQSGTEFGVTLGTPIGMMVRNEDQRPKDYGGSTMDLFPRPSHADFTYLEKYGVKASSGGGRSSARETIGTYNDRSFQQIGHRKRHRLTNFRPCRRRRNC